MSLRSSLLVAALLISAAPLARAAFPSPQADDPTCTDVDRKFMERAYEMARYATAHGGAPFGAVLVKDGQVIAEYANCEHATGDVTKHAETRAHLDLQSQDQPGDLRGLDPLYEQRALHDVLRLDSLCGHRSRRLRHVPNCSSCG